MSSDLKALTKSEKLKRAEKHLCKYLMELKRHFDFSDFQIVNLLENTSDKFKQKTRLIPTIFNFFKRKKY